MTSGKVIAYRERLREGRVVLSVEVDAVAVEEMLIRAGLLDAGIDHDRADLNAALSTMIARLCELDA